MQTISTTCPYCGTGCGVKATVDGDKISVTGDPEHPANFGRLCVKGSALDQVMGLEGRLLYPQINGRRADWNEALDLIAQKFRESIAAHGPNSVAFYVSGQLLTEDYYVANKLMKGFVGSANIDTNSRLCMSASVAGHKRAFGSDTVPGCYEDLEQADLVVLTGSNLAWCHPILFQRLAAAREKRCGKPIVVNIDPRRTATSAIADLHLQLAPGSDVALFLGLLEALRRARKESKSFVNQHSEGLAEALAEARKWTLPRVAEVTGLAPHDLRRFYDLVIAHDKSVTVYSQGVNQSWAGSDKVNAIINTHLFTARIGQPGCGPLSVTGQPNAMGGREVGGLANMLAAHMDLENPFHRALVGEFWKAPAPLPQKPGLKAVDLFKAVHDGRIRTFWIMATNPVDSLPDADFVREALQKCPFVVVSDVVENTDTSAHAHVLLPALAWGEKDGVVTNSERRISRQRALRPAPGEARADWRIICDVAARMGFGEAFAYDHPAQIFAEHARLSGFRNGGSRDFDISAHAWISAAQYDRLAPFQWPAPAGETPCDAPRRFFAEGKFFTPGRKARFVATPFRAPAQEPTADAPFVLNTGRVRDQWHTMTRTGDAEKLSQHIAEPFAEFNPLDAARLGVKPASLVRLKNTRGEVLLRAQISERQRQGSIFVPIHWTDQFASNARVGKLVAPVVDPVSGQPESKAATVATEVVTPAWFAFGLTREKPEKVDAEYWALARTPGGWRIELAGFSALIDAEDFARKLFGGQDCNLTALHDERVSGYRCVATRNNQTLGAFYLAPHPVAVARAWACEQFAANTSPLTLLAGQPPANARDPGRKMCVCLNVGVNTILDAIRDKALISVSQISDADRRGNGVRLLPARNRKAPSHRGASRYSLTAERANMRLSDIRKAGHWPTLLSAFLYFDISFMAWVSLGPLMVYIAREMNIPVEQKLTLVAIPVLSGAILRIPMGILADTIGSKITGVIAQIIMTIACLFVWRFGLGTPNQVAIFGALLGLGGASFAVALPQASRWYPPQLQGVVMGIAGAGNMGVVLDTLFAPSIAEVFGWQGVYAALLIPMIIILGIYIFKVKDAPGSVKPIALSSYGKLLLDSDSRWFMFFYFITFGGFVGLASALPLYFTAHFHVTPVAAGLMVSLIVFFGSTFRPVGGAIADRIGGIKSLTFMFVVVSACYFGVALLPEGPAPASGGWGLMQLPAMGWLAVALFSVGTLCLGMGNGAVFQLLPQRFRNEVGVMTGLVGFAGGLGGFFLAKALATSKGMTGGFMAGFLFFSVLALLGVAGLSFVKNCWRTTWGAVSGARI